MKVTLQDIFVISTNRQTFQLHDLYALDLRPQFLQLMNQRLKLSYIESSSNQGNICLANNIGVQPEYRTQFTKTDLLNYVGSFLSKGSPILRNGEIPFPENAAAFWIPTKVDEMQF